MYSQQVSSIIQALDQIFTVDTVLPLPGPQYLQQSLRFPSTSCRVFVSARLRFELPIFRTLARSGTALAALFLKDTERGGAERRGPHPYHTKFRRAILVYPVADQAPNTTRQTKRLLLDHETWTKERKRFGKVAH